MRLLSGLRQITLSFSLENNLSFTFKGMLIRLLIFRIEKMPFDGPGGQYLAGSPRDPGV